MRWSAPFVMMVVVCAVTSRAACAFGLPKYWSLPELVAFSDVVAVIDVTTVGEVGPQEGEVGLCTGLGTGYQVRASFVWVDRITQSPFVRIDETGKQVVTFFRSEFAGQTKTGQYLAFLLQADTNEYRLVALPNVTLFHLDPKPVDRPVDLRISGPLHARLDAMTADQAHEHIQQLRIPDQEQRFTASVVYESHENHARLDNSMCRFTAAIHESPGQMLRVTGSAYLFELGGYFPCDRLDRDALITSHGASAYDRCRMIVEGNWSGGYYLATRIYSEECGLEVLKAAEHEPSDVAEVFDIAQRSIQERDNWADGAQYYIRPTDVGWTVVVTEVLDSGEGGDPPSGPGGQRVIKIDSAGNVLSYSDGQ